MRVRLIGLVFGLLLSSSAPADPLKSDWPTVEALRAGKRVLVRLYKDEAPKESRAIQGRFSSAGSDDITLVQTDGRTRTIAKSAVLRVAVQRPTRKRVLAGLIAE